MPKQNTDSSNVEALSWVDNKLSIHFKSGQVDTYKGVPEGIYAGALTAISVGSYLRLYVCGVFPGIVEKQPSMDSENKKLTHYKDSTIGMWATDRPDLIPENLKEFFCELKYQEFEIVRDFGR